MKINLIILVILITACTIQAQITDGLYAYYPFSGSIEDQFGNFDLQNTGDLNPVEDRFGEVNCAYWFPGNDSIFFETISEDLSNNIQSGWSISLWYKGGTNEPGDYEELLAWGPYYDEYCSYLWLYDLNTPLGGAQLIPETYPYIWADQDFTNFWDTTAWHHIVMTINPQDSLFQLYVDNELQPESQSGISLPTEACSGSIKIGKWFRGTIDDIFIYHKGLSQDEITTLYNLPSACVSDPVSVKESASVNFKVNLFPNPSKESLQVETDHLFERFSIITTDGKVVKSDVLNEQTVDISLLNPGIYFLQLQSAKGNAIRKFIKE